MSDLETLLAPLVESAPDPAPLTAVVARAAGIRRRRRARSAVLAFIVLGAITGVIAAFLPRDDQRVRTVSTPQVTALPSLQIGSPSSVPAPGMDMILAFGSLWISQPEQVARLDPDSGKVLARIRVPGSSDYRNLAAGAGSIWVDDTATEVVTRIDPVTNRVEASIPLTDPVFVTDGVAFLDGKLWIARPMPNDDSRAEVVAIDPTADRIEDEVRIPRTFDVLAGSGALWYVPEPTGSVSHDLVRLDAKTLQAKVVRHDATAVLAIADGRVWLQTTAGVIEIDERTGARIGRVIPVGSVVNATAAVADGVLWLAWQADSSSSGTITPYDAASHRALSKPVPVGLPISNVVVTSRVVWVQAGGLTRVPFSR
jgi:hypothetical protein